MSSARISIDDDAVQDLLREAAEAVEDQVNQGVEKSARTLNDALRRKLNRQGKGRVYTSARGRSRHQASLPGNPPATDTGIYRNSWTVAPIEDRRSWMVFTPLERGPWLEYGTDRMAPRPHARPAAQEHQEDHNRIIREAVEEGIKRAG